MPAAKHDVAESLQAPPLGSVLNKGLDLLGRRYRVARRRHDDRHPGPQTRLVLVHPLHNDIASVGVVGQFVTFSKAAAIMSKPAKVERCPPSGPPREAKRHRLFRDRDYSYRSKQVAGDGWVLVGDAFGFSIALFVRRLARAQVELA